MTARPLIAHVLYRLDTGGMERVAVSLINATRDRYRHAVITLAGFGELRRELDDHATSCQSLNKQPGKDWACHARFWRALRRLCPDLVQSYNIGTLDLAPMAKLAGVRGLVHAEHGRDAGDPADDSPRYRRLRRWMAPFIDRYVAVSRDLEAWLTGRVGLNPSKVTYIANGIDTVAFRAPRPRPGPRRMLRDFAPEGTCVIGNVARLDAVKNHLGLITAFKRLRDRHGGINCRLVIAGDGPERAALEQRIAECGLGASVRLLGNRSDVPELLAECDIFVLSSISEGMPLTVLEAMASGLPVVATEVGDVASVVEPGVSGTLVPSRDPDELAKALGRYAADAALRCHHGEAGCARVTARFGLGAMIANYVTLYDELLGERVRAAQRRVAHDLASHGEH